MCAQNSRYYLYTDASKKGYGCVLFEAPLGKRTLTSGVILEHIGERKLITEISAEWKTSVSVNEGEYLALIFGIWQALSLGIEDLVIHSDSELIVRQLNGLYRVQDTKLKECHREALTLLKRLKSYVLRHIRGVDNPADEPSRRFD